MEVGKKVDIGQRHEEFAALSFTPHWFAYVLPIVSISLLYFVVMWFVLAFEFIGAEDKLFFMVGVSSFYVYAVALNLITVNYNVYQISNRKIFNSRIVLPAKIKKTEIMLDLVKSFQTTQSSFFSQMLDYGTIRVGVNLAGDDSNMVVRFAPKPQKILELLNSFEK